MRNKIRRLATLVSFLNLGIFLCTQPLYGCLIGAVGGSLCFISSTQKAFNQDIMGALAFLGFVVVLWRLIMRIRVYAARRQPLAKGRGSASPDHGKGQTRAEDSDLGEHPNGSVIKQNMTPQVQRIWNVKTRDVEQDLHESV